MLKGISLSVGSIAGANLEDACESLCVLSKQLDIMVCANFNGIYINATTFSMPEELLEQYEIQLKKVNKDE